MYFRRITILVIRFFNPSTDVHKKTILFHLLREAKLFGLSFMKLHFFQKRKREIYLYTLNKAKDKNFLIINACISKLWL